MLGSRTKQVNSYGKRRQRIVNAEELHGSASTKASIFDDLTPAQWAPVVSKMKKRENVPPAKLKTPSPKVVGQKKKRLSPIRKPAAQKAALARQTVAPTLSELPPRLPLKNKLVSAISEPTPPRTPLASHSVNAPGSPAFHAQPRRRPMATGKGTPLRLNKPFTPFVDMDIIVLDDDGRTISKERRVSRTETEGARTRQVPIIDLTTDSGSDAVSAKVKPPKRLRRRAPVVISDDESESDAEEDNDASPLFTPAKPLASKAKPTLKPQRAPSPIDVDDEASLFTPPKLRASKAKPTSKSQHAPSPIEPKVPAAGPSRLPRESTTPQPLADNIKAVTPPIPQQLHQPSQPTRYRHIPSPTGRPRQLTPLRGAGGRLLFEPPSPSPSASSYLDLSLELDQLDQLDLDFTPEKSRSSLSRQYEVPVFLLPLLEQCHQETCGPHEFSSFINTFPFDPIVQSSEQVRSAQDLQFRKIGEASYSEVFGIGDVVLKVIPIRHAAGLEGRIPSAGEETDGPFSSEAPDVLKELIVTEAMGEVCEGFVKLLKAYVVRGRYPEVLLDLWDEYYERKGSESIRPDTFTLSQVYVIIVLPNGGPDLENYTFKTASRTGWRQACSIFWQVTKALAQAEQLVSFEHRDLHWGQILIKDLPVAKVQPLQTQAQNQKVRAKPAKLMMDDFGHGVRVTLIDLGLSRMDAGDGDGGEMIHWTPFDDEIFMGEGDYQFDIYRMMKVQNDDSWEPFKPLTNVMWLHYLAVKLLRSKRIRPPPAKALVAEKECYECLMDIENWLEKCLVVAAAAKGKTTEKAKGRRKTQVLPESKVELLAPLCAGELLEYGIKKGWVKPLS